MADREPYRPMAGIIYASMLPSLQETARRHGYALAVHGSMTYDFDLVAIPWSNPASSPRKLIDALIEDTGVIPCPSLYEPEKRSHGRLSWTIPLECGYSLDISVMPIG